MDYMHGNMRRDHDEYAHINLRNDRHKYVYFLTG